MFHAEKIQQIINQLQHADGMGYFDTLLLILKLVSLCIVPLLFVIAMVGIAYIVPVLVSTHMKPTLTDIQYEIRITHRKKYFEYVETVPCNGDLVRFKLKEQGLCRFIIQSVMNLFLILMLSPLIFTENDIFEFIFIFAVIVCLSFFMSGLSLSEKYFPEITHSWDEIAPQRKQLQKETNRIALRTKEAIHSVDNDYRVKETKDKLTILRTLLENDKCSVVVLN